MPASKLRRAWTWSVAAATAAVFARSLSAGFIDLDDPFVIVGNPHIRGLGARELCWMFGLHWAHWYPLTWISFALDHAAWGARPIGYHLTSVALHALNAALVFRLVERLLSRAGSDRNAARLPAAAFAALLFSLHPLRVESVTWATERSDVLASAFALATTLAWFEGRVGAACALHALGLCAKGIAAPLPFVLALLDRLGVGGGPRRGVREEAVRLAPMLALSAAAGALDMAAQNRASNVSDFASLGALDRAALGSWNYAHGLARTLCPTGLRGLYPMPRPFVATEPRFLAALALVAGLTALAWALRRRSPAFTAAWGSYALLMAPMAGFVKTGPQLMADRYAYLPAIGFAGLAAGALARARAPWTRRAAGASATLILVVLAALSWRRQGDWLDADRFWAAQTRSDPRDALSWRFRGARAFAEGRREEAEDDLRRSATLDPASGATQNTLGLLRASAGRYDEAVAFYRAAIALEPENAVARYDLAAAFVRSGRRDEAVTVLREELALLARRPGSRAADAGALVPDEREARALGLLAALEAGTPPGARPARHTSYH